MAPVAMQKLAHDGGEAAAARAASAEGTCYILRDRSQTLALVRRAEAAGCVALVITVDAPVLGRCVNIFQDFV
eukprot:1188143-Prorocentrum_minimum.AAC.3